MNNNQELIDLLRKKIERQTVLKERSKALREVDENLFAAKFGRWFGTTYLKLKRVITIILSIALLFGGIFLIIDPGYVIIDEETTVTVFKETLRMDVLDSIRWFGVFMICMSLVFLYIAYLIRKMIQRNRKISKSETLTQEIIQSYRDTIKEEEKEIAVLQEFINRQLTR